MERDDQDAVEARLERVLERVSTLAEPARSQIAVVCASHLRPALAWARATSVEQFDDWVRQAWEAAVSSDRAAATRLAVAIAESPDAATDDPLTASSVVARAVVALQYACDSVGGDAEAAAWAVDATVGALGEHTEPTWAAAFATEVDEVEPLCARAKESGIVERPDLDAETPAMRGLRQGMTESFGASPSSVCDLAGGDEDDDRLAT